MILPTGDCLKLVVAIEARPYRNLDPAGTVTIIKFEDLSKGTYTMKVLNFSHFDDKYEYILSLFSFSQTVIRLYICYINSDSPLQRDV